MFLHIHVKNKCLVKFTKKDNIAILHFTNFFYSCLRPYLQQFVLNHQPIVLFKGMSKKRARVIQLSLTCGLLERWHFACQTYVKGVYSPKGETKWMGRKNEQFKLASLETDLHCTAEFYFWFRLFTPSSSPNFTL